MAGTYGAAGLNPYTITGIGGILSNEVNATTGVTQIYRGTSLTRQESIGTYNPSTGQFTPDANANLTENEKKALSNSQNIKIIRDKSIETATRAGATNAQQLLSPNSAPSGSNPDPEAPNQAGTPPPVPDLTVVDKIFGQIESKPSLRMIPDQIRYPKKMDPRHDRVMFQSFQIIGRAGQNPDTLNFTFGSPQYQKVDGAVFIAIQAPISDQNSVDWGPDSVNAIDAAIYAKSMTLMNSKYEEIGGKLQELAGQAYNALKDNQQRIQRYLGGQAANINNILARTDNVILNPNLELLFQGPQLRPFSFQFKMSARGKEEANDIKRIINYFKYHMSVRKENGLFLKAPHVFKIDYQKGEGNLHPGINKISNGSDAKMCALTNCSVDYTPLGSYMTYEDGTMVAYTLSLQFQEITPVYDEDYKPFEYKGDTTASIGY
jgi:hypothetical protein